MISSMVHSGQPARSAWIRANVADAGRRDRHPDRPARHHRPSLHSDSDESCGASPTAYDRPPNRRCWRSRTAFRRDRDRPGACRFRPVRRSPLDRKSLADVPSDRVLLERAIVSAISMTAGWIVMLDDTATARLPPVQPHGGDDLRCRCRVAPKEVRTPICSSTYRIGRWSSFDHLIGTG
jgi:hypothetical protein